MSLHFCAGELAGVGLFEQDSPNSTCCTIPESTCQTTSENEDCCNDEFVDLDWETDIAVSDFALSQEHSSFLEIAVSVGSIQIASPTSILPKNYVPPLVIEDIRVHFAQFLI